MLLFDDSNGTSDIKESSALRSMLAVGNEFMTFNDGVSTVQRSGEFVRIEKITEDVASRFLLLMETSDVFTAEGAGMDDADFYAATGNLRQRTWFLRSEQDAGQEQAFKALRSALDMVRMPRYTRAFQDSYNHQSLLSSCYTAIAGKRRVFPTGDGKVYVVRDVIERGGRHYYGLKVDESNVAHRVRATRVSRVEIVALDSETGKVSAPVFGFPVFSGLGVDIAEKVLSASPTTDASLPIVDVNTIRIVTAGLWWGRAYGGVTSGSLCRGGDAGDTYAVAEPAVVKEQGKTYTSVVAVYAGDDDVHDARSSGPYRLTCKRTTADGGAATVKIALPAMPLWRNTYPAAIGLMLLRHSPSQLSLRVHAMPMQSGVPSDATAALFTYFYWSSDNGATWSAPREVLSDQVYGSMLAAGPNRLLIFSTATNISTGSMVREVTPGGITQIGTVMRSALNAGLYDYSDGFGSIPYIPRGFGGVVYRNTPNGRIKRLWMQFDPQWLQPQDHKNALSYPCGRPCLAVSDDDGATWQRRFLPTPWCFLAGFVVAIDATTLAVPVYAPRKTPGAPVSITVNVSKNGGESWQATGARAVVDATTRIDGNITFGSLVGTGHQQRQMQDLADAWTEYNPGELHPLIVLRDKDGKPLNSNPARPWMVDARIQEPADG